MPFIRKLRIEKEDFDNFISNSPHNVTQPHSILSDLKGVLARKEYKIILTSEGNDIVELKLDENSELYLKVIE